MKIVVVGVGYVGLVSAVGFASLGHEVVGVDGDDKKVEGLNRGVLPIYEEGLQSLVDAAREKKLLRFSCNVREVLPGADFCFICVGTPPKENGEADVSFVEAAVALVAEAKDAITVLVIKSTVPVGTGRRLQASSNPEFLREGKAVEDFLHPDRIVMGVFDEYARSQLLNLYASFACPKVVMTPESSELTKYAANGFLATKISFINEIANVCDLVGADVREVAQGIGLDPRIGSQFLKAGLGYGGSCFPKDTRALHQIAGSHDYDFRLLGAVIETNREQRARFVQKVFNGTSPGDVLAVWGLAFKAGTDDVRESAAVEIIETVLEKGYSVRVYDPLVKTLPGMQKWSDRITIASNELEATDGADALLVLTEWPEFREVDFNEGQHRMKTPKIFDGRNLLADLELEKYGFAYVGVGLGKRT